MEDRNSPKPLDADDDDAPNKQPSTSADSLVNSEPNQSRKKSGNFKNKVRSFDFDGSWTWEVICAIVSLICTALLIGFLASVNGKRYDDWQYTIAPNTVVSIVAAFSKAAMLVPVSACIGQLKWSKRGQQTSTTLYDFHVLDQASRGPWGAMQVFWHVASILPMLGSLLVILSLAIDPFSQQILAFPSRQVVAVNGSATIQTAQEYYPQWIRTAYKNFNNWYGVDSVDPKMQLGILNGLAQEDKVLEPTCPSSHCEYPDFESLGFCSTCHDVTEQSKQTCIRVPKGAAWYGPAIPPQGSLAAAHVNCTYTSPIGLTINPLPASFESSTENHYQIRRNPWSSTSAIVPVNGKNKNPSKQPTSEILSFFAAQYFEPVIFTPENVSSPEKRPKMTQCSLYMCEKRYVNNRYLSSSHRNPQPSQSQDLEYNASETMPNPEYEGAPGAQSTRSFYHLHPSNGSATFSKNSTYVVESQTMMQLANLLANLFDTTDTDYGATNEKGTIQAVLATADNISSPLDSMATSMTNVIRENTGGTLVDGATYSSETFIQVRWPWIIFPVTLVCISIAFMVATILAHRGQSVLWKSSVFPFLFGQLEVSPEQQAITHMRHLDELNAASKKFKVMIYDQDEQPLLFVEQ